MSNPAFATTSVQIIEALVEILKGPTSLAAQHARYVGAQGHEKRAPDEQSSLIFWGHRAPVLSQAAKRILQHMTVKNVRCGASEAQTLQSKDVDDFRVWRAVWDGTQIFEIKSIALKQMTSPRFTMLRIQNPEGFFELASDIDNWAHSDELSSVLADILERDLAHFKIFKAWNVSINPWLRRQSIVGLYCYARARKRPLDVRKVLPLVKNLLLDEHFYVQRGVGWALREIDRVNSILQRKFVRTNLSSISSVAWFATSELYPLRLRASLANERRKSRR